MFTVYCFLPCLFSFLPRQTNQLCSQQEEALAHKYIVRAPDSTRALNGDTLFLPLNRRNSLIIHEHMRYTAISFIQKNEWMNAFHSLA